MVNDKKLKILYVCPLAHSSGHYPYAATAESQELAKAGADVTLLTFCGITGNPKLEIEHHTVVRNNRMLEFLRHFMIGRWMMAFAEVSATIAKAIRIYRRGKYDAIYLRDGQPFLFMAHLTGLPFRDLRWVVSMTGSDIFLPKLNMYSFWDNPLFYMYVGIQSFLQGVTMAVTRAGLRRGRFAYVTQNDEARQGYEKCFGGALGGKVVSIPLGTSDGHTRILRDEARERLGLPKDKLVLLLFGTPHVGKDTETILGAVGKLFNVVLFQTGKCGLSLSQNTKSLASKYGLDGKVITLGRYIGEDDGDRPYIFAAADAIVLSYTKEFKCTSSMLWQAARYGVPVISSNANILGEMVREYNMGLLFEAEDASSLAETIRQFDILGEKGLAELRAGCGRFLGDHSHKRWARNTIKVCEEVAK